MAFSIRKHHALGDSPADRARRSAAHRAEFDRERDKSPIRAFYRSREWREFRKRFIQIHPYCAACGKQAKHVDHIVPIRQDWSRRLDSTNMQSLCHSCHSRKTAYESPNFRADEL